MGSIEVLISFDIDDTLLDHQGAMHTAAIAFFHEHRAKLGQFKDPESFARYWHALGEEHMARYLRREITFPEQRRCRIRSLFGRAVTDGDADALYSSYLETYEASWQLFSDVVPVLETLRSAAALAVISNGNADQQREKLRVLGVDGYFQAVITPEDAGVAKPAREIFEVTSARLGIPSSQCIYIGNHLANDAEAAARAGWLGVWLNRGAPDGRRREVLEVRTLGALPAILSDVKEKLRAERVA